MSQRTEVLERLSADPRSAADVMTSPPITVATTTPLPGVAEVMVQRRLKRLPVLDAQGALAGMVSRVDLLRTAAGGYAAKEPVARDLGLDVKGPVGRVVRRDVPVVHPETRLPEVFQAVISTRLNRALVVDAERRVVGLVTDAEMLERITPSLRPGALRSLMSRLPFASTEERTLEKHSHARTAADLMSREVASVKEDVPVASALATMLRGNHKVLAVVDADGRLVGMVDRADLLHGMVQRS
jgi:CBS domain-containing protein